MKRRPSVIYIPRDINQMVTKIASAVSSADCIIDTCRIWGESVSPGGGEDFLPGPSRCPRGLARPRTCIWQERASAKIRHDAVSPRPPLFGNPHTSDRSAPHFISFFLYDLHDLL